MKNGLLDPAILSFVFTPLVVTVTLLLSIWWKQVQYCRARLTALDTPGLLLASVARQMPEDRLDWGTAMLAELDQIPDSTSRWWFALSCIRVALFPPHHDGLLPHAPTGQSPACGMLAVALPPLGLPFIYFAAVIMETIGGSPFTQSSRWSNPDAVIVIVNIIVKLLFLCLLAGLPLGLAGLLRHERLRWLSVMGMLLSTGIIGYFVIVMHFTAGGPNGD
jgi:hypothetical protein